MATSLTIQFTKKINHLLLHASYLSLYIYQGSTDFRINVAENKYERMKKFENIHIFTKRTLGSTKI